MKLMKLCSVLFLLILMGWPCVSSQPMFWTCSSNYTSESDSDLYRESIREVSSALINASSNSLFHNTSSSSSTIYGFYQCRGDISLQECSACVNESLTIAVLQECPSNVRAHVFMEYCHVKYGNQSGLFDGTELDMEPTFYMWTTRQIPNATYIDNMLAALLAVTGSAPVRSNRYADSKEGFVYAQAQCDSYLSNWQCSKCLGSTTAIENYINKSSSGGRVIFDSCFYRYEDYLFYNAQVSASPSPSPSPFYVNQKGSIGDIVGGVIGSIMFVGLFACLLFFYYRRKKISQALRLYEDLNPFHPSAIVYSYDELRAATQDFHPHNKLGQGGFGPVYKGMLADGQEVAIKKLSIGSHQGKIEFTNEVTIVTSIQHKNLIKLFGCCIEGPKRLLVYEYMPNKSLDMHLFDREDVNETKIVLDWKTRVEIIQGVARGLAYLHEDSQVHIIHRDIKPGNILLDKDLMPKIADFGLARLFNGDIDHVTTTIAGTIGYLSPEYAMHGQLTEKADVFSFGVVTLEIVSGRRNTDYTQPQEKQHLLEWACKCYKEEQCLQLLDPQLINLMTPLTAEEEDELTRVIHVAILCTQSSTIDRPSMFNVVQLLAGKYDNLDVPSIYPFSITTTLDDLNNFMDTTSSAFSTHRSSQYSCSGSRQVSNVTAR